MRRLSIDAGTADERGRGEHMAALKAVLPYLWPPGRPDLKLRVVLALVALVAAKVITVWTPFAFKYAVDALTALPRPGTTAAVATVAVSVPIAFVVAYGVGRIMMVVFAQLRDAFFAKVGQHAVRQLAIRTFRHLHELSLRFHLDRRTGKLSRVIERGTKGVDTILRYSLFNTFPTVVEIVFVGIILWWNFGWFYVAAIGGDRRRLHRLHLLGDGMADQHPAGDERRRQRRQHEGARQSPQLRDGEILRKRGARSGALRQIPDQVRASRGPDLDVACGAERRTGGRLLHGAHRHHGVVGLRRRQRTGDGRRFRHGERA